MRRLSEIKDEIASERAGIDKLELAIGHADNDAQAERLMIVLCHAVDYLHGLAQELFEAEDMAAARERASDRAWGGWAT